jgi:LysM repeat protein
MIKKLRLLLLIALTLSILFGGMNFETNKASAYSDGPCTLTHVVQPGQNLFRIGLMYGVRWDVLQYWNHLANPNLIYVGQVLCVAGPAVPSPGPVVTPPTTPPGPVVVYPGNPFGPTKDPRAWFPEVTLGQSFQLRAYNFPPNRQAVISMAPLGQQYVAYYTATTGADGTFHVSVTIPDGLKASPTVAVQVTTSGGYYAKNWFYNR